MEIQFDTLPAVYINLDSESNKRKKTEELLSTLGFLTVSRSPGVVMSHKRAGVAEAHIAALANLTAPVAVFEDDCELLLLKRSVSVPDDADAVFLGHIGITSDNPKVQTLVADVHYWGVPGYPDLYKVQGVLSAHALIYVTDRYLKKVTEVIVEKRTSYTPQDVYVSTVQKDFNVYCLGTPLVYQSGQYKNVSNKHITLH